MSESFSWYGLTKTKKKPRKKRKESNIENVIGVTDLPDDFKIMRDTVTEMRDKVKEVERKYCAANLGKILVAIKQNMQTVSFCGDHPRRTCQELYNSISLMDTRHINAVTDGMLYILEQVLHSSAWFMIRLRRLFTVLKKCQRAIRRWLLIKRQKQYYLINVWCAQEAQEQSQKASRRFGKVQPLTEVTVDYFGSWVPKDLKAAVVQDLYTVARRKWKKAYQSWKEDTHELRVGMKKQYAITKKMVQVENSVRFLCGLPPHVPNNSNENTLPPPPAFFWMEEVLTEKSIDDFMLLACQKDRENSIARLASTGVSLPHARIPDRFERGTLQRPCILAELLKAGNKSVAYVCSLKFNHHMLAGQREIGDVSVKKRKRRTDVLRKSFDQATKRAILLGSPLQQAEDIAFQQASDKLIKSEFQLNTLAHGSIAARDKAKKMEGLTCAPATNMWGELAVLGAPKAASKERKRWIEDLEEEKPSQQQIAFYIGECTFKGCRCKMFKVVDNEISRKHDVAVCAHCDHWSRYHGVDEKEVKPWRAAVTFGRNPKTVETRQKKQPKVTSPKKRGSYKEEKQSDILPMREMQQHEARSHDLVLFQRSTFYNKHIGKHATTG
eukprot:TRINITY_DN12109_c0_g1_i1.p1 TRINITY_DN12109_c0_g1~~TRINITY_DN12109_c0_g1_i1.p1  ORF type:complete len:611 (+),score=109.73 TRINITY_DN12109_c0_g1_i1:2463-4295(+)